MSEYQDQHQQPSPPPTDKQSRRQGLLANGQPWNGPPPQSQDGPNGYPPPAHDEWQGQPNGQGQDNSELCPVSSGGTS
ncbi:hypothetical protein GY45DRAFT_1274560 [Cubamyces sp. BRFM 1775]|nr:hypothetical protein GY45DRAFT_1274560 [Cubamyces sp. BRFM 1775]